MSVLSFAGGISGVCTSSTLYYNINEGNVTGKSAAGGLCGFFGRANSTYSKISGGSNSGTITAENYSQRGDLIGANDNS